MCQGQPLPIDSSGLPETCPTKLKELYDKGLLDKTKFFDERLEVEYYELWHHEGRRAPIKAMLMAPDCAWWHGFYW